LEYGRYPDAIRNLPLYPGATDAEVTCTTERGENMNASLPVTRITRKFLTHATPQQVADYYNNTLLQYAWQFWDQKMFDQLAKGQISDPNLVHSRQAGDINSSDGLVFRGRATYDEMGTAFAPQLNILATKVENDRTMIELRVRIEQHRARVTDAP
jgi:hypothetical protein